MADGAGRSASADSCSPEARSLIYDHFGKDGLEGTLRIDVTTDHPLFQSTLPRLQQPHTVLLGFSLGNGYFSRKRVEIAVCGFAHLSGDVAVIVPDAITLHTYRALGYSEEECKARVKKYGTRLKKRAQRAITLAGKGVAGSKLRLLDWNGAVATTPSLGDALARLEGLFETNMRFRSDVLATARSVLKGKCDGEVSDTAAREAANYLLSELAFVSVCREQLGEYIIVPYHKPFTLGADLCAGVYGDPVPSVGWTVYDIELANQELENGDELGN